MLEPTVKVIGYTTTVATSIRDWLTEEGFLRTNDDGAVPNKALDLAYQLQSMDEFSTLDNVVEFAGRMCYQSFEKGRGQPEYIENILESRHGSVTEHASILFGVKGVSRTLTHELIRHRAGASYSELSQRYVDAKDFKFVLPPAYLPYYEEDGEEAMAWENRANSWIEDYEFEQAILTERLKKEGYTGFKLKKRVNEAARSVLPGCTETKIVAGFNVRSIRHILESRGSEGADVEIRRMAIHMATSLQLQFPQSNLFSDIEVGDESIAVKYSKV